MTNLETGSQHYVDAAGKPLSVRGWYRFWVLFFFGAAAWLAVAVATTPGIGGFDAGTREGGSGTSAALGLAYAYAWLQDVRHVREERSFWVRRNRRNAMRGLRVGAVGTAMCLVGLVAAMPAGDTYIAGLLVAPGTAAVFCLALCGQVRLNQRQRGE